MPYVVIGISAESTLWATVSIRTGTDSLINVVPVTRRRPRPQRCVHSLIRLHVESNTNSPNVGMIEDVCSCFEYQSRLSVSVPPNASHLDFFLAVCVISHWSTNQLLHIPPPPRHRAEHVPNPPSSLKRFFRDMYQSNGTGFTY